MVIKLVLNSSILLFEGGYLSGETMLLISKRLALLLLGKVLLLVVISLRLKFHECAFQVVFCLSEYFFCASKLLALNLELALEFRIGGADGVSFFYLSF